MKQYAILEKKAKESVERNKEDEDLEKDKESVRKENEFIHQKFKAPSFPFSRPLVPQCDATVKNVTVDPHLILNVLGHVKTPGHNAFGPLVSHDSRTLIVSG
ncbi:hypothetical protein Nepgr_020773 [Nepenthes gracilis]|uniref:Uncharacterized protein n=1 Tax=Nepenthes gracilis TaxID=150966 RepID=A0AAD3SYL2_NEPGR|nr:hypothetical protein Nepgr_020773 [Nepenthes gracilis]